MSYAPFGSGPRMGRTRSPFGPAIFALLLLLGPGLFVMTGSLRWLLLSAVGLIGLVWRLRQMCREASGSLFAPIGLAAV